jgi:nucleotide-binding universal stress UspA family protein
MSDRSHGVNRVLIASDARESLLEAMAKVATIEHYTGAAVEAALVVYDPIAEEPAGQFSRAETRRIIDRITTTELKELDAQMTPFKSRIAELQPRVLFERDVAKAIVNEAKTFEADLIVKPLTRSARITDFLHAPADWRIMRDAPTSVLFTRHKPWPKSVCVLAALDVSDKRHQALNERILVQADLLSSILGGDLHVVTAYPTLGQQMNDYQVANDFEAIKDSMRARRQKSVVALLEQFNIEAAGVHVVEGRPRIVIATLADRLGAGLTVLGTAARKGIKKLLIGNTAEEITRDLDTDLLTVRAST